MSEASVKKYIVRLSREERATLEDLISKGKHPSATILKARVLLKADVSEGGEGWSDSRIVQALDTSLATYCATIWMRNVLPHSGMLPSEPGIASPECSP